MEFNLNTVQLSYNDLKKDLTLPKEPSKELSEFIGILTGDGYIGYYKKHNNYILEICGHSHLDLVYLQSYVKNLIKNLFNLEPSYTIRSEQNTCRVRVCSKGLIQYLERIGFVKGKKEQIKIPEWIFKNDSFMKYFVRGLVDTDGSLMLFASKNNYPAISITSKSKILISQISTWLIKKGFKITNENLIRYDKRGFTSSTTKVRLNGRKKS